MSKKYALIGGYVRSQHDFDMHFVSANDLLRLYGLDPKICVLLDSRRPESLLRLNNDLIRLNPREDGKYD